MRAAHPHPEPEDSALVRRGRPAAAPTASAATPAAAPTSGARGAVARGSRRVADERWSGADRRRRPDTPDTGARDAGCTGHAAAPHPASSRPDASSTVGRARDPTATIGCAAGSLAPSTGAVAAASGADTAPAGGPGRTARRGGHRRPATARAGACCTDRT